MHPSYQPQPPQPADTRGVAGPSAPPAGLPEVPRPYAQDVAGPQTTTLGQRLDALFEFVQMQQQTIANLSQQVAQLQAQVQNLRGFEQYVNSTLAYLLQNSGSQMQAQFSQYAPQPCAASEPRYQALQGGAAQDSFDPPYISPPNQGFQPVPASATSVGVVSSTAPQYAPFSSAFAEGTAPGSTDQAQNHRPAKRPRQEEPGQGAASSSGPAAFKDGRVPTPELGDFPLETRSRSPSPASPRPRAAQPDNAERPPADTQEEGVIQSGHGLANIGGDSPPPHFLRWLSEEEGVYETWEHERAVYNSHREPGSDSGSGSSDSPPDAADAGSASPRAMVPSQQQPASPPPHSSPDSFAQPQNQSPVPHQQQPASSGTGGQGLAATVAAATQQGLLTRSRSPEAVLPSAAAQPAEQPREDSVQAPRT